MTQAANLGALGTNVNSSGDVSLTTGVSGTLPASALPAGSILQVLQTTKTDTFSASGSSGTVWFDITGISVSITPSSTSSRILILTQVSTTSNNSSGLRLVRNSTALNVGNASGSRSQTTSGQWYTGNSYNVLPFTLAYVDSPATTSATTYKVQAFCAPGTFRVNQSNDDNDNFEHTRSASSIIVMEIAG